MLSKFFSLLAFAFVAQAASLGKRVTCAGGQTTANAACCAFFSLRADLQANLFDNQCGEDVHEVLRLAFHDAIGFSASGAFKGHGADGSLIIFDSIETAFASNQGLDDPVDGLSQFFAAHPTITAGDMIQFAAAVGITNCPGAPQLQFLAGRPNATIPASDGTVPDPQDSVTSILNRVADAGLTQQDMVNLLVSHTIARSDTIDPTLQQVPFDTTPFTFDTQFFVETLLRGTGFPGTANNTGEVATATPNQRTMRLASDALFARDSRTACQWQSFVNNHDLMASSFRVSMEKMAVIGQNTRALIDCSDVIPTPKPALKTPAFFPPGHTRADLQLTCTTLPFPTLSTAPGPATPVPLCPDGTNDPDAC